jgi:hypothetical protein
MRIALHRSTFALAAAALFAVVAAVPSDTSDLIPAALAELPEELGDDIAKLMADMDMEPEMTHFARFVATDVSTVNHSLALIRCAFGVRNLHFRALPPHPSAIRTRRGARSLARGHATTHHEPNPYRRT